MITLQIIGLGLDFLGVGLLGIDLIRIQNALRTAAKVRISRLEEIADEYGGVEEWAIDIGRNANWAEHADIGEGLYEPIPGAFDADAASSSFGQAMQAVSAMATRSTAVADLVLASYIEDRKNARSSLIFSYVGLALILLGFSLQIVAVCYSQ